MYLIKQKHRIKRIDDNIFFGLCAQAVMEELKSNVPLGLSVLIYTVDRAKENQKVYDHGGAYFHIDVTPNYQNYEIHICGDVRSLLGKKQFSNFFNYRLETFLEALDIPVNTRSIFLLILLHEFGHAYIYHLFSSNDMSREHAGLHTLIEGLQILFSEREAIRIWQDDYNISLPQFVNGLEAQADVFAMKHFFPLWKKVQNL